MVESEIYVVKYITENSYPVLSHINKKLKKLFHGVEPETIKASQGFLEEPY